MRIVFMGTPDFAVPSLENLIQAGHCVCGVFCQPDKPVGRHQNKLQPPPIKQAAMLHQIPVFQPVKLRDGTALDQLKALAPDLIVVAAYGRILPDEILNLPAQGCINVHSSLLPKYRGAAPINWAILNGESESGVTIMYMASELDAGDIILQRATRIDPEEDASALYRRLADMGGELVVEAVEAIQSGTVHRIPQDPANVTLAPMLSKALSPVDWSRSAQEVCNQIRGLIPWPGASTDILAEGPVKLWKAQVTGKNTDAKPGSILAAGKQGIEIACGDGAVLRILELQAPGSRRMAAADYLRGHPLPTKTDGK